MNPTRRISAFFLCLLTLLSLLPLTACGGTRSNYKVLDVLAEERWNIAFRQGDSIRDIVSAALSELAASGELARLSSEYLGDDYSCLKGEAGALETLAGQMEIPEDRVLLIGVEANSPPLSLFSGYMFSGLIPTLAEKVCGMIGWEYRLTPILAGNAEVELASGNVDCVWVCEAFSEGNAIAVTPGYLENEEWLVVHRDSGILGKRGLRDTELAVTNEASASKILKAAELDETFHAIWTYGSLKECFTALDESVCAALLADSLTAKPLM